MGETFHHQSLDPGRLADLKRGRRVSVCLPARDEEATIGAIVTAVRSELQDRSGLVDEIVVVDDGSVDRTAAVAGDAGGRVVAVDDVVPEVGPGAGEGGALWKAVVAAPGDLLVFCDADVRQIDPAIVTRLLGPLLTTDYI